MKNKSLYRREFAYFGCFDLFITSGDFLAVRPRCLSNRLCFISEVDESLFNLRIASWIRSSGSMVCFSGLWSPRYCETNIIKREIINTWHINIVTYVSFELLWWASFKTSIGKMLRKSDATSSIGWISSLKSIDLTN